MHGPNKKNPEKNSSRQAGQIVEQLAELLRIKKNAIDSACGDSADEITLTTIEHQEKALYAELRSALRPSSRRQRTKRVG